tara:strand:- start:355 stop:654 length:300 start_codon:yes stop_codon:yes gene_type:complete
MKSDILSFIKSFFVIAGIEVVFLLLMIFFVMTDEPIGMIGKSLGIIVKYVLGFPLVLLNGEYPFFINSSKPPNYMIPLVVLNLIIQTGIVMLIRRLIKS